jgi:hypothetical protein
MCTDSSSYDAERNQFTFGLTMEQVMVPNEAGSGSCLLNSPSVYLSTGGM